MFDADAVSARRDILKAILLAGGGATLASSTARAGTDLSAAAPVTTIINARIFDGRWVLDADSIIIENGQIAEVGKRLSPQGVLVDARGGTMLPGLIDAHTHTADMEQSLRTALLFGVTTELDMGATWSKAARQAAQANNEIADLRTTLIGMSAPWGHPSELFSPPLPTSNTTSAADARAYVNNVVVRGDDYVKIIIEDGKPLGKSTLPMLSTEAVNAAVSAGHEHGKLVIAHVMSQDFVDIALNAGADGMAHLFLDTIARPEVVQRIARSKMFIVPCLVFDASIAGENASVLAQDPRVADKLSSIELQTLKHSFRNDPSTRFEDVITTFAMLHNAGVDLLAGTDCAPATPPFPSGLAVHGASLHHELQLFVRAGMTPIEALRAATSATAQRFDLTDRGRISPGLRADLLLVDGDPTRDISSTLSIMKVWKKGWDIKGAGVRS